MLHCKSIPGLCDIGTSHLKFNPTKSTLQYNRFVKHGLRNRQKQQPIEHKSLRIRSNNTSPSVGQYDVQYRALEKHQYQVIIREERQFPQLVTPTTFYKTKSFVSPSNSINFQKQLSRQQYYQSKGCATTDHSPNMSIDARVKELDMNFHILRKHPHNERQSRLALPLSYTPMNAEQMMNLTKIALEKHKITPKYGQMKSANKGT